jgi:hypothetical protein
MKKIFEMLTSHKTNTEPDLFKYFANDSGKTKLFAWSILQSRLVFESICRVFINGMFIVLLILLKI